MPLFGSTRVCVCPSCQHTVVADRPRWYWRLAVVASWGVIVLMLVAMCFAGILVTALLPFLLLVGAGLVSTSHEEAFRPARCPRCRRSLPAATPEFESLASAPSPVAAIPAVEARGAR